MSTQTPFSLIGLNILGEHVNDVPNLKQVVVESGMSAVLVLQSMGLAHELCDLSPNLKVMLRLWDIYGDGGPDEHDKRGGPKKIAERFSELLGPNHRDRIIFTPFNEGGVEDKRIDYEIQYVDLAEQHGFTVGCGNWGAGFSDEMFLKALPIYRRVSGTRHGVNYHEYMVGRTSQFHGLRPIGDGGEWVEAHFDPMYQYKTGDPKDLRNYSNWTTGTAARHEYMLRNLYGLTMNWTCPTETGYDEVWVSCSKGTNYDIFDPGCCPDIPADVFLNDMKFLVDNVWSPIDETSPYFPFKGLYIGSNIFTYGKKAEGWKKFDLERRPDIQEALVVYGKSDKHPLDDNVFPIDELIKDQYNSHNHLENINKDIAETMPTQDLAKNKLEEAGVHGNIKLLYTK